MTKEKRIIKESKKTITSPFKDYWSKSNYIILAIGLIALIIGYYIMAQGKWDSFSSLSVSPIILLIGYITIIPIAIFYKLPKMLKQKTNVSSQD